VQWLRGNSAPSESKGDTSIFRSVLIVTVTSAAASIVVMVIARLA
jgi:hypothetical protein